MNHNLSIAHLHNMHVYHSRTSVEVTIYYAVYKSTKRISTLFLNLQNEFMT